MQSPQAVPLNADSAARPVQVPIIEVAFKNDMWWSLPRGMSSEVYETYLQGEDGGYTWDWGDSRDGAWAPEGEVTSINRYVINFITMEQRNLENGRLRSIRIIWVGSDSVQPRWSGQIQE